MNAPTPAVVTKESLKNRPLPLHDIQGVILCDYGLPVVRHFFVRVDQAEGGRNLIGALVNDPQSPLRIATAAEWTHIVRPSYALNVGFTYSGLQALHLPATTLASFEYAKAFTSGAAERATLIGDCGKSTPHRWRTHLDSQAVHVLFSLYAEATQLASLSTAFGRLVRQHSCTILHQEDGGVLEDTKSQKEGLPGVLIHFGYRDGISQPVIEGAPRSRFAAANATAVKAGAFLLGYPSQWEGFQYAVPYPLEFGRNGSFAAFRILQQDVAGFEKYLTDAANAAKLDRETIAAKICGRWRNGAPLTVKTQSAMPPLPANDQLNDFTFSDDSRGLACPFDAHIRRTNPRGEALAGADGDRHPLVRRGMPYGPKYDQSQPDDNQERGLLGLFICASIEDQFEFLMTNWMNRGGFRPELTSKSKDLIAGNNTLRDTAFQLPTTGTKAALPTFADFVTTRGSAYCFLPSLTGLKFIADL
jgi:Dyp-type peroxidase family